MGRRAEQHSKYITNVPAAASGVPTHLLSPRSSSDDLCFGYQSRRRLNWVETAGAGEEGGWWRWWRRLQHLSLLSLTLTEPQLEPSDRSALMDGGSERQDRSIWSVYALGHTGVSQQSTPAT